MIIKSSLYYLTVKTDSNTKVLEFKKKEHAIQTYNVLEELYYEGVIKGLELQDGRSYGLENFGPASYPDDY